MNKAWSIPIEEGNGNIENSGKVLTLQQRKDCNYGVRVKLQDRGTAFKSCSPLSDSEMWFRSKEDNQGYFTLQNLATGKYLTAEEKKLTMSGIPAYSTSKYVHSAQRLILIKFQNPSKN